MFSKLSHIAITITSLLVSVQCSSSPSVTNNPRTHTPEPLVLQTVGAMPTATPHPTDSSPFLPATTSVATLGTVAPMPTETVALPALMPLSGETSQISVGWDGRETDNSSEGVTISADGRFIAFVSGASQLIVDDREDDCLDFSGAPTSCLDVFVYDQETGELERVSVAGDGTPGNADSGILYEQGSHTSLSGDGRYVAFISWADNLVPEAPSGSLYVYDRETKQIELISQTLDGSLDTQQNGPPILSANGRFVVFESQTNHLVADDANGFADLFVFDRDTRQLSKITVASDGSEANGPSGLGFPPAVSADGRFIAFASYASNLVDQDTNEMPDVFVYDQQTGQTELISLAYDGSQALFGDGIVPTYMAVAISADGRYVAFDSEAHNLVIDDTNQVTDIFVHDRLTREIKRISVTMDGQAGNGHSRMPTISADGQWVAFVSEATNLVENDTNGVDDIFIHDQQTGRTERLSLNNEGVEGNGWSLLPVISADGQWVVFKSFASNLGLNDTNGTWDVFVRHLVGVK